MPDQTKARAFLLQSEFKSRKCFEHLRFVPRSDFMHKSPLFRSVR